MMLRRKENDGLKRQDYLVLNSVSNVHKALEPLSHYENIQCFWTMTKQDERHTKHCLWDLKFLLSTLQVFMLTASISMSSFAVRTGCYRSLLGNNEEDSNHENFVPLAYGVFYGNKML